MPNILLNQIAGMIDLIGDFIIAADAWTGNIQNEMDARYVEQSSLTNLFTEHKFWGWAGLLLIFVAIAAIFYFQFQAWEQQDQMTDSSWKSPFSMPEKYSIKYCELSFVLVIFVADLLVPILEIGNRILRQ